MAAPSGIGALLLVDDTVAPKSYYVGYDGRGSVTMLVDPDTLTMTAGMEYGIWGDLVRATGNWSTTPFLYSTKWSLDHNLPQDKWPVGLYDYGFRMYSPSLGRFISRDPIGEAGGLNLYQAFGGDPVNNVDFLGLNVYTGETIIKPIHSLDLCDRGFTEYFGICLPISIQSYLNSLQASGVLSPEFVDFTNSSGMDFRRSREDSISSVGGDFFNFTWVVYDPIEVYEYFDADPHNFLNPRSGAETFFTVSTRYDKEQNMIVVTPVARVFYRPGLNSRELAAYRIAEIDHHVGDYKFYLANSFIDDWLTAISTLSSTSGRYELAQSIDVRLHNRFQRVVDASGHFWDRDRGGVLNSQYHLIDSNGFVNPIPSDEQILRNRSTVFRRR